MEKLKEQGLRERFLSLKKMFEEESREQAEVELKFKKEIERDQDKLEVFKRELKVTTTRARCFQDENANIEIELEKTQNLLDELCREIQSDGVEWRNELQALKFKVVEQEHENKRKRNISEEQEEGLLRDIKGSLKQRQIAEHARVMDAYKEINSIRTETNKDLKTQIREESRKLLKGLKLEREAGARMKKAMLSREEVHRDVIVKADHEVGLLRDQIRKVIDGREIANSRK